MYLNPATLQPFETLWCRLSISAISFCLKLVFDVSFLNVIESFFATSKLKLYPYVQIYLKPINISNHSNKII